MSGRTGGAPHFFFGSTFSFLSPVGTAVYYGGCDRLCNALFKSRAAGEKHGGTQLLDGDDFDAIESALVFRFWELDFRF